MEHCNIEFITEIDSTNEYLKRIIRERPIKSPYCVSASSQIKGKGQRGKVWESAPFVNITASYLVEDRNRLANLASLSPVVATTVYQILQDAGVQNIKIKWPNDVYVGSKKIAGILIEPIWSGKQANKAVVGIGLNVNQAKFPKLNATSILLETGTVQHVGDLLVLLYRQLYRNIQSHGWSFLEFTNEHLYKRDEVVTFEVAERRIEYVVKEVLPNGNLKVERDNGYTELEHHRVKWII